MTGAIAHVSEGDLAWWRGDRAAAVAEYRSALAEADGSPEGRAAEVMARARLLSFSGNLGPFVHEVAMDRARAACPALEAWCAIAEADVMLFLPAFTGADPGRVDAILHGIDSGPARARRVAAGADARLLDRGDLDGMGRGIRETGRLRPFSPGTWVLNVGIGGAPGAGIGGVLRFVHPDVGWRADRVEVAAGGDSRGGALLSGAWTRPGAWQATALAARSVGDVWIDDEPTRWEATTLRATEAWIPSWKAVNTSLGVGARADRLDLGWLVVGGPLATVTVGSARAWSRASADVGFGSYTHVGLGLDTRGFVPVAGGTLALRAAVTHVPTPDTPFLRLPSVGGADVLRGESTGRWRGPSLLVGQFEARHAIREPVHAAAFVDSAWVDGWHATVGGGLRLVLPPDEMNTTRLDVGWAPETGSWGVVVAWGEAF